MYQNPGDGPELMNPLKIHITMIFFLIEHPKKTQTKPPLTELENNVP
jgi:hypothetical protein